MFNTTKGTFLVTISTIVFVVCGYLTNILLGKHLGPAAYGIYGIIITLMTAVNMIQTSGIPQATTKFVASRTTETDIIFKAAMRLQIFSTLILTLIYFLCANWLARLLHDPSLTPYIQLSSLILPFYSIFALYTSYYNGLHKFHKQALISIIYSISKLILVVGFVYLFHLYGAVIGFICSPIIALLFGIQKNKPAGLVSGKLYRELILFSLPLIGFSALSTILISIDLFFLKSILGSDHTAGLYSAAQNIARIPYFAFGAFAVVLFPTVARSISTQRVIETSKKIKASLRYLLLLLIPASFVIASTSRQLLQLLYSSEYTDAASSLSWLTIGLAVLTLFVILANVINAAEKPMISMFISAMGLLVTAIFCWLLIPIYGSVGAAIATTIGGMVTFSVALLVVMNRFSNIVPWDSLWKIMTATVLMYIVYSFIFKLNLFIVYIILFTVYALALKILREITAEEMQLLRVLIPKGQHNNGKK